MLILPLGHVKSIHDFIFASMTVITTKFGRIIDQHGITFILQVMMALLLFFQPFNKQTL